MTNEVQIIKEKPIQEQYSLAVLKAIETLATNEAVDIERMQRLLDVQERIMAKRAESEFFQARAEMQKELPLVYRAKQNNHTKTRYAGLDEINQQVLPVLANHGFSVRYRNDWSQDARVVVTAILSHFSGHSQENTVVLPFDGSGAKNQVQAIGSSITYAQRYALCGLLNITLTDDNDANDAGATITHEQAVEIDLRLNALPDPQSAKAAFKEYMGVDDVRNISASDYKKATTALDAKEKSVKGGKK